MKLLISQTSIYLHQHPTDANLTVEDLHDMVGRVDSEVMMKRLQRYAAKVQGSSQFWYQKYQELRALLKRKGSPTFFCTLSSADPYWPELHSLMPHSLGTQTTHSMRVQAVIDNPHLTDWFFSSKLSQWVDHWLYNCLDAEWHWYRLEYQARGSTHCHGCVKFKNDPGICTLVQKAAAAWELCEHRLETNSDTVDCQIIGEGEKAKAIVLEYCDWLVTTMNDNIPDECWCPPAPHPCAVSIDDITDFDSDYHNLINCVHRHTRCSTAYCLKIKPGQEIAFKYTRPFQSQSSLSFERLPDGNICAILVTQRNDPHVNSHNHLLLQNWRSK